MRLLVAFFFVLLSTIAISQGCGQANPGCIVPTAPPGTNDNRAASTAYVTQAVGAATGGGITGLTGDISATGPGTVNSTIQSGAVSNSKLSTMAAGTIKGSLAGGAPIDMTGIQAESILQFLQSGTGAVQRSVDSRLKDVTSVKDWGAQGNSNGTHGNGNDDSAAFASAINNANGNVVYVPCGTYRLGSTVTPTSGGIWNIYGNGWCSKIFLDSGTSTDSAFVFQSASACLTCLKIQGLHFLNPNVNGQAALSLINESNALISNITFEGANLKFGVFLTTSFAPRLIYNFANSMGGTLVGSASDESFNNSIIWYNRITNSGSIFSYYGIGLVCLPNTSNISIVGNDIELGFAGINISNCNSVSIRDNYIDLNGSPTFAMSGTNTAVELRNNWINSSSLTTSNFTGVTGLVISGNQLSEQAFTFSNTALGVHIDPNNALINSSTIGATKTPTISSCGGGSPSIVGNREAGAVTVGTSATACTVTFELPWNPAEVAYCVVSGNTLFTRGDPQIAGAGNDHFVVNFASSSGGTFEYHCKGNRN